MKSNTIKSSFLSIVFVSTVIFGTTSCENHEENKEEVATAVPKTEEVAKDQNAGKFNDTDDEKNAKFLVKASEINLEEINLGKLAQQKSTSADIKELGKMMETSHTKGQASLTVLASKKGISIPTVSSEEATNAYNKLNEKSEQKDFNKAYADMMVDGHKKAIDLFEKESTESSDADIRAWATSVLPELRKHLDHAIMVQTTYDKMK